MRKPPVLSQTIARGVSLFQGDKAANLVPQSRLAGPMPWVIAIMVSLTVIAAAGGLALHNVASSARAELVGGATVQVLAVSPRERELQTQTAIAILEADPAVVSIRRIPDEELDAMLEPWLGGGGGKDAVPVPALVDVRFAGEIGTAQLDVLRVKLAQKAPDARLDAQASWLGPVFGALESLQWLAIALVILLAVTSAAAVWLAARSALGVNQDTIEIIHLLGGTDLQIARIFERSIGFDAALGGLVGLILGLAAILLLGGEFASLGSGMMAGGGLGWFDWILIALVPLAAVGLAMLTARVTVTAALRRML